MYLKKIDELSETFCIGWPNGFKQKTLRGSYLFTVTNWIILEIILFITSELLFFISFYSIYCHTHVNFIIHINNCDCLISINASSIHFIQSFSLQVFFRNGSTLL